MLFTSMNQSQSNSQNTNLGNNINIGGSGTGFGAFSPNNEASPEFKNSADFGLSAAIGAGATSGPVGMSRAEDNFKGGNTFDGYRPTEKNPTSNIIIYVGIALTLAISLFSLFKRKKS